MTQSSVDAFDVALASPGWPPGRSINGITTYVGLSREGLAACGIRAHVLSLDHVRAESRADDIIDLTDISATPTLWDRLVLRALDSLSPTDAVSRKLAARIRAATEQLQRSGRDLVLEIEESFGIAEHLRRRDFPLILRLHGPWFLNAPALGEAKGAAFKARCNAERRASRYVDGITAPSRHVLEAVSAHWPIHDIPTAVIPNAGPSVREDQRWIPESFATKRILYVGRFDKLKGPDVLLAAFERIVKQHPDAELLFVGPDSGFLDDEGRMWKMGEYLEARVDGAARAKVRFLGVLDRPSIEQLRRTCALTIVASRQESFSLATLEALSFGSPVIASNVGGIPEIINHDENGLLFTSGSVEELAESALRLLGDASFARALSERAYADGLRYRPEAIAKRMIEFYAQIRARKRNA